MKRLQVFHQNLNINITPLWIGNKTTYENRAKGFPALPLAFFMDNPAIPSFTQVEPTTFYFTNFDYLLRLRLDTPPAKALQVVHHTQKGDQPADYLALTHDAKRLYTFIHGRDGDYLAVLSFSGSELKRLPIRRKRGIANRLFGKMIGVHGPSYPFRSVLTPQSLLLVWEPYMWHQLCAYDLEGQLVQEWEGVKGVALDEAGSIWVNGSPEPSKGVRVRRDPSALFPGRWTLLGRNRQGNWYWKRHCSVYRTLWKDWTHYVTQVICESSDGRLLWRIELDGPGGVLRWDDPNWKAGWLEVEGSGALLAFCITISDKVEGGVGLYRVEVEPR